MAESGPEAPGYLRKGVECLLFISGSPLKAREMALALEADEKLVERAAQELVERDPEESGLVVQQVAGGYQMVTAPEYALTVARFVGKRAQKLSRAALETLAIIAYNQPCTLPEIEAVRGVDSSGVAKSLLDRGLIRELGRKDAPGRPLLLGTTDEFLIYFGLNSLEELPDQEALERVIADRVQPELPMDGEPEGAEDSSPLAEEPAEESPVPSAEDA